jgi:hypothetical protein
MKVVTRDDLKEVANFYGVDAEKLEQLALARTGRPLFIAVVFNFTDDSMSIAAADERKDICLELTRSRVRPELPVLCIDFRTATPDQLDTLVNEFLVDNGKAGVELADWKRRICSIVLKYIVEVIASR